MENTAAPANTSMSAIAALQPRRGSIVATALNVPEGTEAQGNSRRSSVFIPATNNSSAGKFPGLPHFKNTSRSTVNSQKSWELYGSISNTSYAGGIAASQNPGTARTASINPMTLSFSDKDLELEYQKHFLKKSIRLWHICLFVTFIATTVSYIYGMVRNRQAADKFAEANTPMSWTQSAETCPDGWLCTPCLASSVCSDYQWQWDLAFYLTTSLLPVSILAFGTWFMMKKKDYILAQYIHHLSAGFILISTVLTTTTRYAVVDAHATLFHSGITNLLLLFFTITFMRIRFIGTVLTSIVVIMGYAFININQVTDPLLDLGGANVRAYWITLIALIFISMILSHVSYQFEKFFRISFLNNYNLLKANNKLVGQLRAIQKTYNNKIADLESPLERCICIIKTVMADHFVSGQNLSLLSQALSLLTTSNLFTPDFDTQIAGAVDEDQQAWLTTEIIAGTRRRKMSTTMTPRVRPRRMSIPLAEVKISSTPIAESVQSSFRSADQLYSTARGASELEDLTLIPKVASLLSRSREYNFPIFELHESSNQNGLATMSLHLFKTADLCNHFQLPMEKFKNWILVIQKGYRASLPYHNAIHAADVLHAISCLCNFDMIKGMVTDLDLLAIYMAAIVHDYDHPGLNNNFLISSGDPKAFLYNDRSVLENHHVSSALQLLNKPENNFLCDLAKSDVKLIREIMIEMVLATDLSQHFPLINLFKSKVQGNSFDPEHIKEDKILLYKILMKCADVSNPTKEPAIYDHWYKRVVDEFFLQGDLEKKLNMPVSTYMDRDNTNIPSMQFGFIDFIVYPLFNAFNSYCPSPEVMENLNKNREYWQAEKEKSMQQQAMMKRSQSSLVASKPAQQPTSVSPKEAV